MSELENIPIPSPVEDVFPATHSNRMRTAVFSTPTSRIGSCSVCCSLVVAAKRVGLLSSRLRWTALEASPRNRGHAALTTSVTDFGKNSPRTVPLCRSSAAHLHTAKLSWTVCSTRSVWVLWLDALERCKLAAM